MEPEKVISLKPKTNYFEKGKFYQHYGGRYIAIVGRVTTYKWGDMLVVEEVDKTGHSISCIEWGEERNDNWVEVSKEEWLRNFQDADTTKG